MTSILNRIREHGGDVIRDGWNIRLRAGRLKPEALEWLRGQKEELTQEVWPEYCAWTERAAIREFCGGQSREEAEKAAYDEVMGKC